MRNALRRTFPEFSALKYLDDGIAFAVASLVAFSVAFTREGAEGVTAALIGVATGVAGAALYILLKFCVLLATAPWRLYRDERAKRKALESQIAAANARSPLQLRFDPADKRFVSDLDDIHGAKFRCFWVSIKNNSDKSIEDARIRVLPGNLAALTVYVANRDAARTYDNQLVLLHLNHLNPGDERFVQLFGVGHSAKGYEWHDGDELALEATGRDVKIDRLTLVFSGGAEPNLSALKPVVSPAPQ